MKPRARAASMPGDDFDGPLKPIAQNASPRQATGSWGWHRTASAPATGPLRWRGHPCHQDNRPPAPGRPGPSTDRRIDLFANGGRCTARPAHLPLTHCSQPREAQRADCETGPPHDRQSLFEFSVFEFSSFQFFPVHPFCSSWRQLSSYCLNALSACRMAASTISWGSSDPHDQDRFLSFSRS